MVSTEYGPLRAAFQAADSICGHTELHLTLSSSNINDSLFLPLLAVLLFHPCPSPAIPWVHVLTSSVPPFRRCMTHVWRIHRSIIIYQGRL
jgi:hypothetical protein